MAVSAKKVLLTSFLVDLLDVGSSFVVAYFSGSVVMLSQVMEGVADLAASGFLIVGLKRSALTPDSDHPFGHGRELYFWTLIASLVMLGITSTLSFYFGWQRFLHPEPISNIYWAYAILVLTIFTNGYALSLSVNRLLKKQDSSKIWAIFFSSPLVETKTAFILDLMGTSSSILGLVTLIIFRISGDQRFDGLGAMTVGVILAIFALFLVISIKDLLVGKSVSSEIKGQIKSAVLETPEVERMFGLKAIYLGPEQIFINLDINLQNNLNTDQIEDIIEQIKKNIKLKVGESAYIQIEIKD
jgi:cation diffusion facilitator family transporter